MEHTRALLSCKLFFSSFGCELVTFFSVAEAGTPSEGIRAPPASARLLHSQDFHLQFCTFICISLSGECKALLLRTSSCSHTLCKGLAPVSEVGWWFVFEAPDEGQLEAAMTSESTALVGPSSSACGLYRNSVWYYRKRAVVSYGMSYAIQIWDQDAYKEPAGYQCDCCGLLQVAGRRGMQVLRCLPPDEKSGTYY